MWSSRWYIHRTIKGYLSKFGLDDPWSNAVNPDVVTGHLHDDDDFDDDDDDDDYDDDDDDKW